MIDFSFSKNKTIDQQLMKHALIERLFEELKIIDWDGQNVI